MLHPFPSILDAAVTGLVAALAGAPPARAVLAALAMALLQTSIGAVNDAADIDHDRVAQPWKPIPAGLVSRSAALAYAGAAGAVGLAVACLLSPLAAALGAAGYACGLLYDVRLSRTPASFAPFAVGIPLLPAFAWAVARGTFPASLAELVLLGSLAGVALALGNGLVDLEADATAGGGVALQIGRRRTLAVLAACELAVLAGAASLMAAHPAPIGETALVAGGLLVAAGTGALLAPSVGVRERGWEAQALGIALLAMVWLEVALTAAPR